MAKPDDRSDNVERIERAIQNTLENLNEADDFLEAHRGEMRSQDVEALESKNARRERAIDGFREEIQDEARHRQDKS